MAEAQQRELVFSEIVSETKAQIQVDIQHLRRIFSNLFSNLYKYADPKVPVVLEVKAMDDVLRISVSNGMKADAGKVESTKIGLQTCEKLAAAMGGEFRRRQNGGTFTAEVFLPILPNPAPAQEHQT